MEKVGHPALEDARHERAVSADAEHRTRQAHTAPAAPSVEHAAADAGRRRSCRALARRRRCAPMAQRSPSPFARHSTASRRAIPADLVAQIKEMALEEFKRALDAASPEDILRGVMEALGRPAARQLSPARPLPTTLPPSRPHSAASPSARTAAAQPNSPSACGLRTRRSFRRRASFRCHRLHPAQGALRSADLHGQAGRLALGRRHPRADLPHRRRHRDAVPSLGRRDAQPPAGRHGSVRPGQREISAGPARHLRRPAAPSGGDGEGLRREVRRRPDQRPPGRHASGEGQPHARSRPSSS